MDAEILAVASSGHPGDLTYSSFCFSISPRTLTRLKLVLSFMMAVEAAKENVFRAAKPTDVVVGYR